VFDLENFQNLIFFFFLLKTSYNGQKNDLPPKKSNIFVKSWGVKIGGVGLRKLSKSWKKLCFRRQRLNYLEKKKNVCATSEIRSFDLWGVRPLLYPLHHRNLYVMFLLSVIHIKSYWGTGERGFESRQISFCQPNSFFCHAIIIDISHIIRTTRNCILFCGIESLNFWKFCLKFKIWSVWLRTFSKSEKNLFGSKHHRMGRNMICHWKSRKKFGEKLGCQNLGCWDLENFQNLKKTFLA